MDKLNVLLVEDDPNLGKILKDYLSAKSYAPTLCVNGKEGLDAFKEGGFQLCILDVMMPVMDGFTLAREIRKADPEIPLLFLTAKSMKEDAIEGFKIGADDYVKKPFSMEELLLRINAIMRRSGTEIRLASTYEIGQCHFDVTKQLLTLGDQEKRLTSKESELLALLCSRKNKTLDRGDALKKIWGDDSYFNARSMDVYITKIRKYLKGDPSIEIINVHGKGFRLQD